jgi:hypothetical protein
VNNGIGVLTDSIMNFFVGCMWSTNYVGIKGGDPTGAAFAAGISVSSSVFNSQTGATSRHVQITGSANLWWFSEVWMETADVTMEVGAGTAGPAYLHLSQVMLAGTTKCLDLVAARQTMLAGIRFGKDGAATPTELTINATNCPEGFAANLVSAQVTDFAYTTFPASWTYMGRTKSQIPASARPLRSTRGDTTSQYIEIDGGDSGEARVLASTGDKALAIKNLSTSTLTNNVINFILGTAASPKDAARLSEPADAETALLVRRNLGGVFSLQRVSVGATDSGGAGFKVLRIPN